MSRSHIAPSDAEAVRAAQREMLLGEAEEEWALLAKAMLTLGSREGSHGESRNGLLDLLRERDKGHVTREFIVEEIPASLCYLHSIVKRGLGDSYNYYDHEFAVEIQPADKIREETLRDVQVVVLKYANPLADEEEE